MTISQPISGGRRGRNLARQEVPEPSAGSRDAQGFQTPSPRAVTVSTPKNFALGVNYTTVSTDVYLSTGRGVVCGQLGGKGAAA